jgi:hypothetical protein
MSSSRWLKVVVRYDGIHGGWIVIAFAQRSFVMNITVGHTTFDRVDYDTDADVLYGPWTSTSRPRATPCASIGTDDWWASRS